MAHEKDRVMVSYPNGKNRCTRECWQLLHMLNVLTSKATAETLVEISHTLHTFDHSITSAFVEQLQKPVSNFVSREDTCDSLYERMSKFSKALSTLETQMEEQQALIEAVTNDFKGEQSRCVKRCETEILELKGKRGAIEAEVRELQCDKSHVAMLVEEAHVASHWLWGWFTSTVYEKKIDLPRKHSKKATIKSTTNGSFTVDHCEIDNLCAEVKLSSSRSINVDITFWEYKMDAPSTKLHIKELSKSIKELKDEKKVAENNIGIVKGFSQGHQLITFINADLEKCKNDVARYEKEFEKYRGRDDTLIHGDNTLIQEQQIAKTLYSILGTLRDAKLLDSLEKTKGGIVDDFLNSYVRATKKVEGLDLSNLGLCKTFAEFEDVPDTENRKHVPLTFQQSFQQKAGNLASKLSKDGVRLNRVVPEVKMTIMNNLNSVPLSVMIVMVISMSSSGLLPHSLDTIGNCVRTCIAWVAVGYSVHNIVERLMSSDLGPITYKMESALQTMGQGVKETILQSSDKIKEGIASVELNIENKVEATLF
eukprot:Selendium_serpulae@DN3942_c0_g1_i1.p1